MQAWEEKYFSEQEAREKGLAEGARCKLKEMISKKLQKGNTEAEISNILEEDIETVRELIAELHDEIPK